MHLKSKVSGVLLCAALSGTAISGAWAAENGNTQYSPGSAQFFAGGVPPFPGLYFLSQTSYFNADRTNDADGNERPIPFEVQSVAETMRFLYVSPVEIAGAKLWTQLVIPVVHLDLTIPVASDTQLGLADISGTIGLAWHTKGKHAFLAGLDIAGPTGKYSADDAINIGLNHWSFQPTIGYHYKDPKGLELGTTARLIFNTENHDTDYTSGTELVVDYAVGWNIDKWRLGAVGYYLQQLTDDSGPRVSDDGNRGMAFAIGPSLSYSFNPGFELSGSWQHDVVTQNRSQGDTFWFNVAKKF